MATRLLPPPAAAASAFSAPPLPLCLGRTPHPQAVVHFWAAWCEPCKLLDQVLAQLATDAPAVAALRVEAEEAADISERYSVSVVPYFLFFRDGKVSLANPMKKLSPCWQRGIGWRGRARCGCCGACWAASPPRLPVAARAGPASV